MPFQFSILCELLDALELSQSRLRSTNPRYVTDDGTIIRCWFDTYSQNIPRQGLEAVAFLSCVFPERRADRVYELKESRLEGIIQTAMGIGKTRMKELRNWRDTDGPDFATAVQRVLSAAEVCSAACPGVNLIEIDQAMDRVASRSRFSSDDFRQKTKGAGAEVSCIQEELSKIFRRLHSSHAKWFVRMLLKTYDPVNIPEHLTLQCYHFLLPSLLRVQNSFGAAIQYLGGEIIKKMPFRPAKDVEMLLIASAFHDIKPQIGVMIAQPYREKARSIQHCGQLVGAKRVSVERKYDGEYCQIHIDLQKTGRTIQIFSKSGRDSTNDRNGLHKTIIECLAIGTRQCKFRRNCILEGELLVCNDDTGQIEPFYKIRRHVKRSGQFLGCAQDSPAPAHEKLMIMFYDLLLLDDIVCFQETHDKRRQRLWSIVRWIPERAEIGSREKIQFGPEHSLHLLRRIFAQAISQNWEGLVLKGCDDSYASLDRSVYQVKLKKDYIAGMGDSANFAVVGGRRDARDEFRLGMGKLSWTHFYLGCLENKTDVCRYDAKPKLRVIAVVDRHGISKNDLRYLNQGGYFEQVPFGCPRAELQVELDASFSCRPMHLFKKPFVVEVIGAGFDKPSNTNYFTLRFPRICKVHDDRMYNDTISFNELQQMAKQSSKLQDDGCIRLEKEWLRKLGLDEQKHRNTSEEWIDTESQHISETTSEQTHLDEHRNRSQIRPELPPGESEDIGTRALRYGNQETPSLSPSSIDIGSLKRWLLATSDTESVVPTKRRKGVPSSSLKAMREQSPSPAPAEMMEPRSTVPLRRQHSLETSQVDKDHTQSQSCIKSTMPILLGSSLSTHNVRPQDVFVNTNSTFTFCTDYFIRTIVDHTRVQSNEAIQQWPYFMIAVDWSRPAEAVSDVAVFASSVQNHNASVCGVGSLQCRIH